MKAFNKIITTVSLVSSVISFGVQADSGSGVVKFQGSIVNAPCSITAGDSYQEIDLGQISSASLAGGGTSTPQNFYIHLEKCTFKNGVGTVSATFSGASSDINGAVLGVTGGAKNIGIVLTNANGKAIELGKVEPNGNTIINGKNTLAYSAYVIGSDTEDVLATEGNFNAVTNWVLTYN